MICPRTPSGGGAPSQRWRRTLSQHRGRPLQLHTATQSSHLSTVISASSGSARAASDGVCVGPRVRGAQVVRRAREHPVSDFSWLVIRDGRRRLRRREAGQRRGGGVVPQGIAATVRLSPLLTPHSSLLFLLISPLPSVPTAVPAATGAATSTLSPLSSLLAPLSSPLSPRVLPLRILSHLSSPLSLPPPSPPPPPPPPPPSLFSPLSSPYLLSPLPSSPSFLFSPHSSHRKVAPRCIARHCSVSVTCPRHRSLVPGEECCAVPKRHATEDVSALSIRCLIA